MPSRLGYGSFSNSHYPSSEGTFSLKRRQIRGFRRWIQAQVATRTRSAWHAAEKHLAAWRSDTQSVTITPDTITGTIPPRCLAESIRQQLSSDTTLLLTVVGVTLVAALIPWYAGLGILALDALLVTLTVRTRMRRYRAGLGAVPSFWSVQIADGKIHIMLNETAFSLALIDVERVKARNLRTPDGQRTEWTALQARLQKNVTVPIAIHDRWLPLTYLSTKPLIQRTGRSGWDYVAIQPE